MDCTFTQLSYSETGYFSKLVNAYISNDERLKSFYQHPVTHEGVAAAIEARKHFKTDRKLLVKELFHQYDAIALSEKLRANIALLSEENTYTICTAHQPAIFTGSLFFIYKILHAIKLAEEFKRTSPENNFIPVFYMGSEDADLDELGNIFLGGEKVKWNTAQKGAVGRMNTKGLEKIIERIDGELSVYPHGRELVTLLKECYLNSNDIQTATLKLINALFGEYGLVVLIPDNPNLKRIMIPVFEEELFRPVSSSVVEKTIAAIAGDFKVQAHPREINLFYIKDNIRERIEQAGNEWRVVNTDIVFNADQVREELYSHPERFSPNVILRGIFQETILPGIVFIGGGGEIAYWLELKELFNRYKVPYPMLVVRNSFLVLEEKWKEKLDKLRIDIPGIFRSEEELLTELVKRESDKQLTLSEEISDFNLYYDKLRTVAQRVDDTLTGHVTALQARAVRPLQELEKKMLRAEKRKFDTQQRQLKALKNALFPDNGLQERVDNFMPFYAKWGKLFIKIIYDHSLTLEQRFGVISVKN